jgi:hypothetical protein
MKEELPAIVAEDPKGGAVGDRECRRDAIGGEGYVFGERVDVVVTDGCWARLALEKGVDDLLAVEDATGDTELFEIFSEEWDQSGAVGFAVRVEETLFERVEMILKLGVGHAMHSHR